MCVSCCEGVGTLRNQFITDSCRATVAVTARLLIESHDISTGCTCSNVLLVFFNMQ